MASIWEDDILKGRIPSSILKGRNWGNRKWFLPREEVRVLDLFYVKFNKQTSSH